MLYSRFQNSMQADFKQSRLAILACLLILVITACSQDANDSAESPETSQLPRSEPASILLITLDTTRADRLGIETDLVATPNLEALAVRGVYFQQAYSVTPTTLPSHTSMLSGLYPADHHVRENGRMIDKNIDLAQVILKQQGYATAAFVSGFPLAGQFGLERGFDHYDDTFVADAAERTATETTDLALAWLKAKSSPASTNPTFMWVHYFDPHEPYVPPEPFLSQYPDAPYLGEIAYMDQELGRLITAFEEQYQDQPWKIMVVGDHGEGLGDHGEVLHGNLLYQSTMRVPLMVAGSGIEAGVSDQAVSVRQVFDTLLDWSGENRPGSLLKDSTEPVLAEALKPYMQYGWQPQFMAVQNGIKVISSGDIEIFNVVNDPGETHNLDGEVEPDPAIWDALEAYSTRALADKPQQQQTLSQEAMDKLASLGYVGSSGSPKVRDDAPSPKDMTYLFHDMDIGAGLFIKKDYAAAIPVFTRILDADPQNFMAALRLAVAYSVTGSDAEAEKYFDIARSIDPTSTDLHHYHAMHYLKLEQWDLAQPLFESVLAESPDRIPALAGLTKVYVSQGELKKALSQLEKIVKVKDSPAKEWTQIGQLRMTLRDTKGAISAFEIARKMQADEFRFHLELGMLYMADRQFNEAAESLDSVSRMHPGYPLALFKRAQTSVLLKESDRTDRVRQAWLQADKNTRPLIEAEPLFRGIPFRQ